MTLIRYLLEVGLTTVLAAAALALVRRKEKSRRERLLCLFWGFVLALSVQILAPAPGWQPGDWRTRGWEAVNLQPFATLKLFFRAGGLAALINLAGNLVMFLPLGLLPPLVWKKFQSPLRGLLPGAACSLTAECLQYFLGRSVDIDDLLLNTLGAALGWLAWRLYKTVKKTDTD